MAGRTARETLRFLRAALHRYEEAEFLLNKSAYTTAAVYLSGYAVECILKALILFNEPLSKNPSTMNSFRGARAHDFDWLKRQLYRRNCILPAAIAPQLAKITWWETELRYDPGAIKRKEAEDFLNATKHILSWAKGRL
jgi:hypothetical protein